MDLLERAEESLFEEYRGQIPSGLASALGDVEEESTIDVDRADSEEFDFAGEVDETVDEDEWELGAGSSSFAAEDDDDGDEPAWLSEETGFAIGGDSDSDEATASATDAASPTDASPSDSGSDASGRSTAIEPAPTVDETSDTAASSGGSQPSTAPGTESTVETGTADSDAVAGEEAEPTADLSAASSPPAGADGERADSTHHESTVLPTDDVEDGDLGGLFDDMGETIDELDDPDAGRPERSEETTTAQPDTSGFDSMFPEDDLASIFDPDSSDDEPANEFDVEPDEPGTTSAAATDADTGRSPASSDADGPETPRSMSTASQPPIGTSRTPNRRRLISMTILRIRRTTGLKTRTTARRRQPASRQRSTTPPIPVPTPTPIPMALSPPMPTMAPMPNLIPLRHGYRCRNRWRRGRLDIRRRIRLHLRRRRGRSRR